MIENEELVFLTVDINEYIKYNTEFREFIILTINWINTLTRREIEILSLLFKNKMAAGRNLIVLNGQFMILTEYHKSQAIMDDIKVCFDVYECSDNSRSHDFFHGIWPNYFSRTCRSWFHFMSICARVSPAMDIYFRMERVVIGRRTNSHR